MRPSPGAGLRRQQEQRQPLPLGPGPARGVGEQAPPKGLRHQFAQQHPRQAVRAVGGDLQVRGQGMSFFPLLEREVILVQNTYKALSCDDILWSAMDYVHVSAIVLAVCCPTLGQ